LTTASQLFLGVDGGQSSTTAVIGDETGRVLGTGVSGPCNHVGSADGRQKFLAAMQGCLGAACLKAALDPQGVRFASACLGFSGGPVDKQVLVEETISADKLFVTTDAWIALSGATGGEPGIIVIAGTGSIAFGRNAQGHTGRAGGWGYIFGDEGGAFDIVRQALRAALRDEEHWGPATALRKALLKATGGTSINDVLHRFYTSDFPRDRIAALAPLVDQAANAGDEIADSILEEAASQLAGLAHAVRGQLFLPTGTVPVACIGGVFRSSILREGFLRRVPSGPPLHSPAVGALIEAYRAVNLNPSLVLGSLF
jgi:N-acetylglucosamine kinase-like BadF-type ATPase